jgi:hypothetical protein
VATQLVMMVGEICKEGEAKNLAGYNHRERLEVLLVHFWVVLIEVAMHFLEVEFFGVLELEYLVLVVTSYLVAVLQSEWEVG